MSEPDLIAVIPKNSIDEIRVSWQEFKAIDTWIFAPTPNSQTSQRKWQRKGGSPLRPDLVGQLCAGSKRYNYKYLTVWGRGGAGKPHAGSVASGNKHLYGKVLGKNA